MQQTSSEYEYDSIEKELNKIMKMIKPNDENMNNALQHITELIEKYNTIQKLTDLHKESEYITNFIEDEENKNKTIKKLFEEGIKMLQLDINVIDGMKCIIELIENYKIIKYTEENILNYVKLSTYFMLKNSDEFLDYIIDEYIFKQNKYYNKLHNYNTVNYYINKKLGTENKINSETLEYIININSEITELYSEFITQKTLNKCTSLVKLNIPNNTNITNVNHLNKLEELNISGRCRVNQEGIKDLKLVKNLNASWNDNIKDVNYLDKLEVLNIQGMYCGVNQEGIKKLKLVKNLNISYNDKIKDVNHLDKLEEFVISGENCGVNQEGIKELKLVKKLDAWNNDKIKDVNHLDKLEVLDISGRYCGVNQEGIKNLKLVKNLNASYNDKITDVNHLDKLEELNISWNCGVDQKGIKNLKLVKNLNASCNGKIKDVNHLDKLEVLDISGEICGVNQEGIKDLKLLKTLNAYNNTKITEQK